MSSTTTTPPSPPPRRAGEGEDFDFVTWFELNQGRLLALVALVCVAIVVVIFVRASQRAKRSKAATELLTLTPPTGPGESPAPVDPTKLLQLAERFAGTPAAEQAQVLAAGQLFADGKFPEAQAAFSRFESQYGNSPYLGVAMLGVAAAIEAQGKTSEALGAYDRVISSSGSDGFAAQARLAKARLLAASEPAQALTLLDDILKGPAAATLGQDAATRRAELLQAHPELIPPATTTNSIVVRPPDPTAPAVPAVPVPAPTPAP